MGGWYQEMALRYGLCQQPAVLFDGDKTMNNLELKYYRYRLYARKSTDTEDKQAQSLDDQVKCMTEIAKREGLRVVGDPIRESKSAIIVVLLILTLLTYCHRHQLVHSLMRRCCRQ